MAQLTDQPAAPPGLVASFARAARAQPERTALAIASAAGAVDEISFGDLAQRSRAYADGFRRSGLPAGARVLLLVTPGIEFIAIVLGLLEAGCVLVMIDPGMDRRSLLGCIERAAPDAVIGVPAAYLLNLLGRRAFRSVRRRWTAGVPWFPFAVEKLATGPSTMPATAVPDPDPKSVVAIGFTTGSTGVPKGVVYSHGNYAAQFEVLQRQFGLQVGDVTLAGYVPYAILCVCLGSTAVVPHFHPARPASVDPRQVLDLIARYRPALGLGSPAFWDRVGTHCEQHGQRIEALRLLLLFGAEVHEDILQRLRAALPGEAAIHTPYGSTEAQPVATISDRELLEPALLARRPELGICVGRICEGVEVELVQVTDAPMTANERQPIRTPATIGEVTVRGAVVTDGYFAQPDQDRLHKIGTPPGAWHRMGDCGQWDDEGRLWLVGRKAHRVESASGTLFTLPIEARANAYPGVHRSALVGVGVPGEQQPVLIVELAPAAAATSATGAARLAAEIQTWLASHPSTRPVTRVLIHPRLPVDYRHNAKIQRDVLAHWAADQLNRPVVT